MKLVIFIIDMLLLYLIEKIIIKAKIKFIVIVDTYY